MVELLRSRAQRARADEAPVREADSAPAKPPAARQQQGPTSRLDPPRRTTLSSGQTVSAALCARPATERLDDLLHSFGIFRALLRRVSAVTMHMLCAFCACFHADIAELIQIIVGVSAEFAGSLGEGPALQRPVHRSLRPRHVRRTLWRAAERRPRRREPPAARRGRREAFSARHRGRRPACRQRGAREPRKPQRLPRACHGGSGGAGLVPGS